MSQRIVSVNPGSLAARHGIEPGETLISISGTPVLDLVDYQFLTARPALELLLEKEDGTQHVVSLHKRTSDPLGLTLESNLMSCPKTCANHCVFCFIEQMPPGMRETVQCRGSSPSICGREMEQSSPLPMSSTEPSAGSA